MTEEIYFSIGFLLAIVAVVLKVTKKDIDISKMKQRHTDMVLDATGGKKEVTNEDTQLCKDMSQSVSVILVSVPNHSKIAVLKEIREITYLGLKEAKDIIESTPYVIKENISNSEARNIKNVLENAGAKVEIR